MTKSVSHYSIQNVMGTSANVTSQNVGHLSNNQMKFSHLILMIFQNFRRLYFSCVIQGYINPQNQNFSLNDIMFSSYLLFPSN